METMETLASKITDRVVELERQCDALKASNAELAAALRDLVEISQIACAMGAIPDGGDGPLPNAMRLLAKLQP